MSTIEDVDRTSDELEAMLQRHHVTIVPGSRLEAALLFAKKVLDVRQGEDLPDEPDDRASWREMAGVFDLGRRVIRAEHAMPDRFEWVLPLLDLFGSETGQLAQTSPASRALGEEQGAEHSDKMFELLVALCLLPVVDWLELDRGRGDNPDILFRWQQRPQIQGIACKRMYSRDPSRFRDTVIKAIDQIERSPAETGTVFVSMTNLINHDSFYPLVGDAYQGFSKAHMVAMLDLEQQRLAKETVGQTDREIAAAFVGKRARRGIVHYLGTMYLTGSEDAPVDKIVQRAWSRGDVDDQLVDTFQAGLNSTSSRPLDLG